MKSILIAFAASTLIAAPVLAQPGMAKSVVSIYRAAPGQQVALLKWLARLDSFAKAAGVVGAQLYVHQDGASWDYVYIAPVTTPAQDKAMDDAARRAGAPIGPAQGIEIRQYVAEHTDTIAAGPTTAADVLKMIGQ